MQKAIEIAGQNERRAVADLSALVRMPSVSFPGFPAKPLDDSAAAVAALLKSRGLENVEIFRLDGAFPYVYGDWLHQPGLPTLLLYAHHDVQPPGREPLWKSAPFEPQEREGRLYGRGSADDKGGVVIHASAIAACLEAQGELPLNVKVLIEGEEEIGSPHLEAFLKSQASRLAADAMVLADTSNFDTGVPSITTALRGLVSFDVTVRSLAASIHSGMWGGPAPDPVQALSRMIASVCDKDGDVAVPGLPRGRRLSAAEEKGLRALKYGKAELRRQSGFLPKTRVLAKDGAILKKLWHEPAFSVNAFEASSRKNCANIVNDQAWCHMGVRTVDGMDPRRTLKAMQDHLKRQAPWGVEVEFSNVTASPAWKAPSSPVVEAAARAFSRGYGRPAAFIGCGGSIPFAGPFSKVLGAPVVLEGVGDPYARIHSENESMHLGDLQKAIRGEIYLFDELARLGRWPKL